MQNDEYKRKFLARIEQTIDWLCVPKGENRHMFLTDLDRHRLLKSLMAHIAGMDVSAQSELTVYWLNTVANTLRKKDMAIDLLRNLAKVLYAGPKMEKWAESRLINTDMEIAPRQMAYEYALITKQDERMVGLYVRDMQRIKHRLMQRIAKTGTSQKRKNQATTQKPRYKRTTRQSERYNMLLSDRTSS
ncbi:MAG: hypothetical protein M0P16_00245 [Syntrophales bacterium]|jgi:hypothetical protein|nr:hypothetical protein [Syntrophales bacterium]